jgi:hypothetical protein
LRRAQRRDLPGECVELEVTHKSANLSPLSTGLAQQRRHSQGLAVSQYPNRTPDQETQDAPTYSKDVPFLAPRCSFGSPNLLDRFFDSLSYVIRSASAGRLGDCAPVIMLLMLLNCFRPSASVLRAPYGAGFAMAIGLCGMLIIKKCGVEEKVSAVVKASVGGGREEMRCARERQ